MGKGESKWPIQVAYPSAPREIRCGNSEFFPSFFICGPAGTFFHSASPHLSRALQEKSSGDQENSRSSSSGSLSIMDLARALTDAGYHVSVVQERSRFEQRAHARPLTIPFSPFIVVTGHTSSPPTPLTPVRFLATLCS